VSFVVVPIRIDHRDLHTGDKPDGVNPCLAIVEAVIFPLDRRAVKDALGISESDSVSPNVDRVLAGVPRETNVNTCSCIDVLSRRPRAVRLSGTHVLAFHQQRSRDHSGSDVTFRTVDTTNIYGSTKRASSRR
jgi:hypothetical protein